MPLTQATLSGALRCKSVKSVTGYTPVSQKPALSFPRAYDTATWNRAFLGEWTLAASGVQIVDLYLYTDAVDGPTRTTQAVALVLTATATVTGGQLRVEPGASEPLAFCVSGYLLFDVGVLGTDVVLSNGTPWTVSATARNIKLSNPGTQSITVSAMAILSGAAGADNDLPSLDFSDENNDLYIPLL